VTAAPAQIYRVYHAELAKSSHGAKTRAARQLGCSRQYVAKVVAAKEAEPVGLDYIPAPGEAAYDAVRAEWRKLAQASRNREAQKRNQELLEALLHYVPPRSNAPWPMPEPQPIEREQTRLPPCTTIATIRHDERRLAQWCLLVCVLFALMAGQASAFLGGVWIVLALGFGGWATW